MKNKAVILITTLFQPSCTYSKFNLLVEAEKFMLQYMTKLQLLQELLIC